MNSRTPLRRGLAALAALALVSACASGSRVRESGPAVPLGLDLYLPAPEANPLHDRIVRLGRSLFHDRRLSSDGSLSCGSCHDPRSAFSQREQFATGVSGRVGRRNVPTLINRAWGRSFFWDGRTSSLEEQVLRPIEDPSELGSSSASAAHRVGLTVAQLARALSSYVRSIRSGNSPFDRYQAGEHSALSPTARMGLEIFRGKGNCTGCHIGPLFTDEGFHNTGVAWRDGRFQDQGRWLITRREQDRGAFKTPSLRQVADTAPYMHDGSLATLDEVVAFYDGGGRPNPSLDHSVRQLALAAVERAALVEFLRSLSGEIREGRTGARSAR